MKLLITLLLLGFPVIQGAAQQSFELWERSASGYEGSIRPRARRNAWINRYEPNSAERKLLLTDPEDEASYAKFLDQADTGMVRLFSYRRGRTISVEELLDGTRPGFHSYASMYSFSKERHGYGLRGWADPRFGRAELRLKDGKFSAAITYSSIALLVCLGDVSLDEVSVNSSAVTPLDNLNPPLDFHEAQDLRKRFAVGFRLNHLLYRSSLPAALNATYALRSTANRRADLLITFRVLREHGDNSLTILWKKLRTYPKPFWQASPDRQDE